MPILAIIGGVITKFLTDRALLWVAQKVLLTTLFMTVLPFVLKTVLVWFMEKIMSIVTTNLGAYDQTFQAITINLTGIGAYLGNCFQLPLIFSLLMSAILLRITLNFIPFIR
jgi:glyoxylate utilization-related uncharacterized protein